MKMLPLNERYFEQIDGTLWVFDKAIIRAGLSVNYYRKEKSKGNKRLIFLDHPKDKRFSLVAFDTMSDDHQSKIKETFGNPSDYVARQPILSLVTYNEKNYQFFLDHDGRKLSPQRAKQYSRACDWLDMLKKVEESRNKIIKDLGLTVPQFFNHTEELMLIERANGLKENFEGRNQLPAKFATSYRKLVAGKDSRLQQYIDKGPEILIDKMYGNQQAAKINDEIAESQLITLIEDPMQYDDVLVCMMYNVWAKNNSYKQIEPATVGVWRRKREFTVTIGRKGNAALNEKFIRQVKGLLPSVPLALVEHDDNNLDFLFTDQNGYDYNKYVAITVVDSRTKLLLGKSYTLGKTPEQWQVHHAYLDAMYYIRSITGAWHLPFEIKADKWASKSLTPFYEKIGKFVPPSHGNKHRGYLEQFYASPLWKRSQKLVSQNNWSGNNMGAKFRGVNEEILRIHAKNRPMIGNEAETQIENFFALLRLMPDFKRTDMNAPSKEEQFLSEWNKLNDDDKRMITDEQMLLTFGIKHEPNGRQISITNRGVEPQINNKQLSYDLPEAWMYNKYPGAKVNVIFDPFDMSRVLVTNYDDIRFIARTAQLQPRALKDQYTSSRTYLNAILNEKKDQVRIAGEEKERRKQLVNTDYYNAEAMLQGGVLIKELKNEAEQKFLESGGRKSLEDMINQM